MKKTPETIEKAAEPVAEKAAETVVEQASKPVTEKAAETVAKPKAAKAKKQPAAKGGSKAAPQKTEDIFVQFGSGEWNVSELAERAKAAYLAEGHRAASIKKLCLYVKPEDGKAYYVVNDKAAGNIEL